MEKFRVVGQQGAIVREEYGLESEKVGILCQQTEVVVSELRDRRARLVEPVQGWCSIASADGVAILEKISDYATDPSSDGPITPISQNRGSPRDVAGGAREMSPHGTDSRQEKKILEEIKMANEINQEQAQQIQQYKSRLSELQRLVSSRGGASPHSPAGGRLGITVEDTHGLRSEVRDLAKAKDQLQRELAARNTEFEQLCRDMAQQKASSTLDPAAGRGVSAEIKRAKMEHNAARSEAEEASRQLNEAKKKYKRGERSLRDELTRLKTQLAKSSTLRGQAGGVSNKKKINDVLKAEIRTLKKLHTDLIQAYKEEEEVHLQQVERTMRDWRNRGKAVAGGGGKLAQICRALKKKLVATNQANARSAAQLRQVQGQGGGKGGRRAKKLRKKLKKLRKLTAQQQQELQMLFKQMQQERGIAIYLTSQVGADRGAVRQLKRGVTGMRRQLGHAKEDMRGARRAAMFSQRAAEAKRTAGRLQMASQRVLQKLSSEIRDEFGRYRESTRGTARRTLRKVQRTVGAPASGALWGPTPGGASAAHGGPYVPDARYKAYTGQRTRSTSTPFFNRPAGNSRRSMSAPSFGGAAAFGGSRDSRTVPARGRGASTSDFFQHRDQGRFQY